MPQAFNLTTAKATPNRVVRRDGKDTVVEVIEFTQLPDADQPVRVLFRRPDGSVYSARRHRDGTVKGDGRRFKGDLFIGEPVPQTNGFVNLRRDGTWDKHATADAAQRQPGDFVHRGLPLPR